MVYAARILIVDDEELIRRLYSRILSEAGYGVTAVGYGYQAIEELQYGSYDALIADLSLPDMDGLDLLERIRQESACVRVLVISGYLASSIVRRLTELGVDAMLDKLNAPDELLAAVTGMLEGWRTKAAGR